MPAPRVWSRDDFMQAVELCCAGSSDFDQRAARAWAVRACRVLSFAEDNATLVVTQARDERGRFLPKPQAFHDSPIVIEARAG